MARATAADDVDCPPDQVDAVGEGTLSPATQPPEIIGIDEVAGVKRRRSGAIVGLIIAAVVAGVAVYFVVSPKDGKNQLPGSASPAATSGDVGPAGATTATRGETGDQRTVRLLIEPANASAEVDGRLVPVRSGAIEITGQLGSTHAVRIFLGDLEERGEIAITKAGAIPRELRLAAGGPDGTATAGATSRTSLAITKTAQSVGTTTKSATPTPVKTTKPTKTPPPKTTSGISPVTTFGD